MSKLTERQMEVAYLVARGFSNPEIAKELGISYNTVKAHLEQIYMRLRIGSRLKLALIYRAQALVAKGAKEAAAQQEILT